MYKRFSLDELDALHDQYEALFNQPISTAHFLKLLKSEYPNNHIPWYSTRGKARRKLLKETS